MIHISKHAQTVFELAQVLKLELEHLNKARSTISSKVTLFFIAQVGKSKNYCMIY